MNKKLNPQLIKDTEYFLKKDVTKVLDKYKTQGKLTPKLDGVRLILEVKDKKILKAYTRTLFEYSKHIPHLQKAFDNNMGFILPIDNKDKLYYDIELCFGSQRPYSDVSGWLAKKEPEWDSDLLLFPLAILKKNKDDVYERNYDECSTILSANFARKWTKNYVTKVNTDGYIFYKEEGLVVYQSGKRTPNLVKIKRIEEATGTLKEWVMGDGKHYNILTKVILDVDGKDVTVTVTGKLHERFMDKLNFQRGKQIAFTYEEITTKGGYRSPRVELEKII